MVTDKTYNTIHVFLLTWFFKLIIFLNNQNKILNNRKIS